MKVSLVKPWCGWSAFSLMLPSVQFEYALSYVDNVIDIFLTLMEDSFERSAVAAEFDTEGSYWTLVVANGVITISEPDESFCEDDTIIAPARVFSVFYGIDEFRRDICNSIKENIDEWASFTIYIHDDDGAEKAEREAWVKETLSRIEKIENRMN